MRLPSPSRREFLAGVTALTAPARPKEKWLTKTIVRRHPEDKALRAPYLCGYLATDRLLPSGAIGPVALEFGELRHVPQ
jgi:hypothetical protein